VDNNQEKTAAELLQAGANPDAQVPMKGPCINVAVANGHALIAKALIVAKANLDRHATVSIGTFQEGRVASGERRGDLIVHTPAVARGATPLIIAIRLENLEMVQLLVESGADVDATDGDGLSPLAWSIRSKFKAAEDCLRSCGAVETGMEGSPIHRLYNAAASGDVEKVREAIASGADVNALVERRGVSYTPLMRAARAGHCDLIRLLLAAGADSNLAGRENIGTNITPLMLAARHGHKGVVELLLQAGAKVDVRIGSVFGHRGGQNAIQQAKDKGHNDIVKLLRAVTTRKNSKPSKV
jgi:serine/threonine-protein phosphatase 6 regulatory ankyrin repeat subunit B